MASNLERFKADLNKLVSTGKTLQMSLNLLAYGKEKLQEALEKFEPSETAVKTIEALPDFRFGYESWYSESLAVVRQLLPDRLADFREHFEIPKNRKELTFTTYRIQDALKGTIVTKGWEKVLVVNATAAVPHFNQQLAIIHAAEKRFDSSLFEIRQLVQADLFDSEIAAARELLRNKFLRAAGAVAGVVLEKHLRQVCDDHKSKIVKKNPSISDLNDLLKSESVIDVPQWRHISMLGDIRNICDHNKQKEPTEQQVTDLIDGTDKVLKTIA